MRKVRSLLLAGAVALVAAIPLVTTSAGADNGNPQLTQKPAITAGVAAAPDQCLLFDQQAADHHYVRKTYNVPVVYDPTTPADPNGWMNVKCGDAVFFVPRGQQALVDLQAASTELDCAGPDGGNGWCEGRFLVNGSTTMVHPNNEGRGDSYAWDSAKGGKFDWSGHSLAQVYAASCPRVEDPNAPPCGFRVQLQAHLTAGADYLWLDDLTMVINANYGKTTAKPVNP